MNTESLRALDTISEAENWRSAVDANSGKTYWYHRKTRESSWAKPSCLNELESITKAILPEEVSDERYEKAEELHHIANNAHIDDGASNEVVENYNGEMEEPDDKSRLEENSYLALMSMLDGVGDPFQLAARLADGFPITVQIEALHYLLCCCQEQTAVALAQLPNILPSVLHLALVRGRTEQHHQLKHLAFRFLCCLTVHATTHFLYEAEDVYSLCFEVLQQVTSAPPSPSSTYDSESAVLVVYWCSLWYLHASPVQKLLNDNTVSYVLQWLLTWPTVTTDKAVTSSNARIAEVSMEVIHALSGRHPECSVNMVDLQWITRLRQSMMASGQAIPAILLCMLVQPCLPTKNFGGARQEYGTSLLNANVQAALQYMCLKNPQQHTPAAKEMGSPSNRMNIWNSCIPFRAKSLLNSLMKLSPTVQERMLNQWIALSNDLHRIPEPELLEEEGNAESSESPEFFAIHRDVEWRPNAGRSWRMNSAVLCARCPALRNIITDFWIETQDTGGGLELSLESHEPVLACICRYIHTGLLLFSTGATQAIDPPDNALRELRGVSNGLIPSEYADQLFEMCEVVRVATQLEMLDLVADASGSLVRVLRTVTSDGEEVQQHVWHWVVEYAEVHGLAELADKLLHVKDVIDEVVEFTHPGASTGDRVPVSGTTAKVREVRESNNQYESSTLQSDVRDSLRQVSSVLQEGSDSLNARPGSKATETTFDINLALGRHETEMQKSSTQSRGRNQAAKGAKSGQIYRLLLDQPEDMPNISGIPNTQADPSMLPDDFEEVGDYNYNENSGDFGNGQLGQLEYSDEFSLRPAESEKKQTPSQKRLTQLAQSKKDRAAVKASGPGEADKADKPMGKATKGKQDVRGAKERVDEPLGGDGKTNPPDQKPRSQAAIRTKQQPQSTKSVYEAAIETNMDFMAESNGVERDYPGMDDVAPATLSPTFPSSISPTTPTPGGGVRSSLSLLKSKTAGLRRKSLLSYAEPVEDANSHSNPPSSEPTGQHSWTDDDAPQQKPEEPKIKTVSRQPSNTSRANVANVNTGETCLRNSSCECSNCRGANDGYAGVSGNDAIYNDQFDSEEDIPKYASQPIKSAQKRPTASGSTHNPTQKAPEGRGKSAPPTRAVPSTAANATPSGSSGAGMGGVPEDEAVELHPCPHCSRQFNEKALGRHMGICEKVFLQKRKVYDSSEKRVIEDGAGAIEPVKATGAKGKGRKTGKKEPVAKQESTKAVPKWKQQSLAFRETMKAAKGVTDALAAGTPLPAHTPSGPDMSLTPCPHCNRRFNASAAERHIPQCQNIRAKPNMLKRGTGSSATTASLQGATKDPASGSTGGAGAIRHPASGGTPTRRGSTSGNGSAAGRQMSADSNDVHSRGGGRDSISNRNTPSNRNSGLGGRDSSGSSRYGSSEYEEPLTLRPNTSSSGQSHLHQSAPYYQAPSANTARRVNGAMGTIPPDYNRQQRNQQW